MNIFARALEILGERGWHQGNLNGPSGEVCLFEALYLAAAEAEGPRLLRKVFAARLADPADAWGQVMRQAVQEVTGRPLAVPLHLWNDQASEEDARLVLKTAARLVDALGDQR